MPVHNTEPLSVYRAGPGYAKCLSDTILAASRAHLKRGWLDHLLALPEENILDLLGRLALHPAQLWGRIANTYVALVDGVCAGTVTVRANTPGLPQTATPENTAPLAEYPFTPQALRDAAAPLGMTPTQVEAVLARQQALLAELPMPGHGPAGLWLLEYVGTRHEFRGGGVARGLLERAIQDIRITGGGTMEVLCAMGNPRAEQLLAAFGFTAVEERLFSSGFAHLGTGTRRLRLHVCSGASPEPR